MEEKKFKILSLGGVFIHQNETFCEKIENVHFSCQTISIHTYHIP